MTRSKLTDEEIRKTKNSLLNSWFGTGGTSDGLKTFEGLYDPDKLAALGQFEREGISALLGELPDIDKIKGDGREKKIDNLKKEIRKDFDERYEKSGADEKKKLDDLHVKENVHKILDGDINVSRMDPEELDKALTEIEKSLKKNGDLHGAKLEEGFDGLTKKKASES